MNILIYPSWYPTKENPMAGIFFRDQAIALSKYGHHVSILVIRLISVKDIFKKGFIHYEHTNEGGVGIYTYEIVSPGLGKFGLDAIVRSFFLRRVIKRIERKDHIDVIHSHSFRHAGFDISRLTSSLKTKTVVTEHLSSIGNNLLSKREELELKYCVEHVDKFICVSNALKNIVLEHTKTRKDIIVVPNMIAEEFCYNKNIEKYSTFTFCAAGGFVALKQYDVMIESFCKAFKQSDNVQLIICGDGVERNNIEELITQNGRQHQIKLLGILSHNKVLNQMQKSHVFVHTSRSETFGVVLIEALACGLPVIGTLNGGGNDILVGYGTIGVTVGDVAAISKAMKKIYDTYTTYDLYKISEAALNRFSSIAIAEQLTNIYKS